MLQAQRSSLLFVLLALAVACGGGSDGSTTNTVPGPPGGSGNVAGDFTPDAQNPGANTVYTTGTPGSGANAALVTLHVFVNDTGDVFGASFDMTYDPSRAQFVNWSPGELLEFGGQSVTYQVNATQPGRVVVGVARTSGGVGVTSTGATRLVNLTIRATQAGSSAVRFENADLLGSQNPPEAKPGVAFFGGTLTAN